MAFFHGFTDTLKQRWLQFFQVNRDWITLHMEVESVYTPDGGKRPPSYLILGVINALEPKLAQLMFPFSKLNPDADTLIEVLDLNFDPDIALGNHILPKAETYKYEDESAAIINDNFNDETLVHPHANGFAEVLVAQEFSMVDSEHQKLDITEAQEIPNGIGDNASSNGHNSKDESHQISNSEADEFGDIAFDTTAATEVKLDQQLLDDLKPLDENAFSDVLSDVWGDETALQKAEGNNDFLGEDLPSGVFDESEIARLFPNA
ncbi:MAG: DUF5331 domain-containing protein [Desmonostoc vinosum HA7617-LM4]|jgi:hypothetical protein|nr:DUF5331 domain-containing protein [Desmonostoc vinosum HA7617-LM4]